MNNISAFTLHCFVLFCSLWGYKGEDVSVTRGSLCLILSWKLFSCQEFVTI